MALPICLAFSGTQRLPRLAGRKRALELLLTGDPLTAVTRGLDVSIGEGLRIEREQFARMAATQDVHEGLDAWIERRTPDHKGRRGRRCTAGARNPDQA